MITLKEQINNETYYHMTKHNCGLAMHETESLFKEVYMMMLRCEHCSDRLSEYEINNNESLCSTCGYKLLK